MFNLCFKLELIFENIIIIILLLILLKLSLVALLLYSLHYILTRVWFQVVNYLIVRLV